MQIYRVGGSVRDQLLGLPLQDEDFVVVGTSADEMVSLGFKPVGKDFPVFLHPSTHQEYALARTERKAGRGYKGFQIYAAPDVTLEQDLARRDLTINAIAQDAAGRLIDPFQGQNDLKAGILRHVSPAFVEDPVRILRVARFAARFGFKVAPETLCLMQCMVKNGEVETLVAERVWQEFSRALMTSAPAIFFSVLAQCHALPIILPELVGKINPQLIKQLNYMAKQQQSLLRRFAVLTFSLSTSDLLCLGKRLVVPQAILAIALLVIREKRALVDLKISDPDAVLALLLRCDAIRRPNRFEDIVAIIKWGVSNWPTHNPLFLLRAAHLLHNMKYSDLSLCYPKNQDRILAIQQRRRAKICELISSWSIQTLAD